MFLKNGVKTIVLVNLGILLLMGVSQRGVGTAHGQQQNPVFVSLDTNTNSEWVFALTEDGDLYHFRREFSEWQYRGNFIESADTTGYGGSFVSMALTDDSQWAWALTDSGDLYHYRRAYNEWQYRGNFVEMTGQENGLFVSIATTDDSQWLWALTDSGDLYHYRRTFSEWQYRGNFYFSTLPIPAREKSWGSIKNVFQDNE